MKLKEFLLKKLKELNTSEQAFIQLIQRLLAYQVIYRRSSQIEASIYDDFVRMEELANDYLSLIGISTHHNHSLHYVVCYPPGAELPMQEREGEFEAVPKITRTLSIDEKLMMICLRLCFEEQLSEGKIDEKGRAFITLEQLSYSFESLGKRSLPLGLEFQSLLQQFKNLRILEVEENSDDSYIIIHNTILAFTLSSIIDTINQYQEKELAHEA